MTHIMSILRQGYDYYVNAAMISNLLLSLS